MINLTGKTLEVTNAFEIKDDLKPAGYKWDAWGKFWGKKINGITELESEVEFLANLGEDISEIAKYIEIMNDPNDRPTSQQLFTAHQNGIDPGDFMAMWNRAKKAAKELGA